MKGYILNNKGSNATTSNSGLLSTTDKSKLDNIEENATYNTISATSPISASTTNGATSITHANSGVTANTYGTNNSTALTPGFGSTFLVPGAAVNATGHITSASSHTVKIPDATATTSTSGLMSSSDKTKLDGVASNATANSLSGTSPINVSASTGSSTISHNNSGVTAGTYGTNDATAVEPSFGDTFSVDGIAVNATGHVTSASTHTVKIPNTTATSSAAGLMSASDKAKLDGVASNATAITVDTALSSSSTNPVQNKVINTALGNKQNTLTAGTNITINGSTISAKDTTYSTVSSSGSSAGLMSVADKAKLDGIEENANLYTLPVAGTALGGVKSGTDITVDSSGNVSVNNNSHSHTIANITNLQTSLNNKLETSLKGANSGLAELDSSGKVPTSQLPSYVDDVLEYNGTTNFPSTGETGKIYVDTSTNKTYRWSGSSYVEISASLALGETESTAYRGDRGAAAYTHAVTNKGSAFSSGLYKITTNSEGHVTAATAVVKSDITALGIPASDTNTDTKVTQTNTTTASDYRLLLSGNANDTTETTTARKSSKILGNASTGEIYAQGYRRIDLSGTTTDVNTLTLSSGSPHIAVYIEKTNGGSSNITNIPVTGYPFILTVEAVRINTTSDYITKQTFTSSNDKDVDYVRWCTNGTWTNWQKRIYTDNNTTYSAGSGLSLSGTTFNHSNSITAGTISDGGSTRTLAFGGTFKIPSVTYDAQGHITETSSITLTMPNNPNVDTKVTNTLNTTTKAYLTGTTSASTNTGTQVFDTGVYLSTTAGELVATTFTGSLNGTASKVANTLSVNGKTFDGSAAVDVGTIGTAYGGTGNTAFNANRLVWSESATKLTAANHYASASKVAINSTSEPSYNLYVNGNSSYNGSLILTDSGTNWRYVRGTVGGNDYWRVGGAATASNGGYMEIATADDGNEPVYVRQYTGTYTTIKRTLTLLDASGNSSFPGNVSPVTTNTYTLGTSSLVWSNVYATTFTGNLNGTASSANTINITEVNPTTETGYSIPFTFTYGFSTNLQANNGIHYYTLEGTTSAVGYGDLHMGNSIASGTAGNKYGSILIYGTDKYYSRISGNKASGAYRTFYLPSATSGTSLVAATNDTAVGSTTQPVYVNASGEVKTTSYSLSSTINARSGSNAALAYYSGANAISTYTSTVGGTAKPIYLNAGVPTAISSTVGGTAQPIYLNAGTVTAITFTANRPLWSSSTTAISSANHYMNATKLAINTTTAPTDNFYVNGAATITGTLTLNKNTDLSGTANNSPALIVGGAVTAAHLELDPDEIQAKSNGTTASGLYLNNDGGAVHIGSSSTNANLMVQGRVEVKSAYLTYDSTAKSLNITFG